MPAGDYEKAQTLGEGTYGVVFRARRSDGVAVAVKRLKPHTRVRVSNEGLNLTALREIKYLRELRHENIIELLDVYLIDSALHLVFEYCLTDLEGALNRREIFFSASDVKSFAVMILRAVQHCHAHFVLHRDLKPANLLISSKGQIKLTDFGFARYHGSPQRKMTANAVTTWYRAPELLFGATYYSGAVDMWAVGLIFIELFMRTALLKGETDVEQLALIFNAFGTPSEATWPGVTSLPTYAQFEERSAPLDFAPLFRIQGDDALDMFLNIMRLNPNQRLTAEQALSHGYVTGGCVATLPAELLMMKSAQSVGVSDSSESADPGPHAKKGRF